MVGIEALIATSAFRGKTGALPSINDFVTHEDYIRPYMVSLSRSAQVHGMKVFYVSLHGGPLTWVLDGAKMRVGFFKNETVLAESKSAAMSRAQDNVRTRLAAGTDEFILDLERFSIEIEEVKADYRFWHLLGNQGFVFYPDD